MVVGCRGVMTEGVMICGIEVGGIKSGRVKTGRVGYLGVTADQVRGRRVRGRLPDALQPIIMEHTGCLGLTEAALEQLIHLHQPLHGWHGSSGRG